MNNIPVFVSKKACHVLSPIISEIFNERVSTAIFPDELKLAQIVPLHKLGLKTVLDNFRPISTLSIFSEVFKKLIHRRLVSFIDKFDIKNKNQFGFLKNLNDSDAILEFVNNDYNSLKRMTNI